MQVHGLTERKAGQSMVRYLTAAQHAQDRGGMRASGHPPTTVEIAEILDQSPNGR